MEATEQVTTTEQSAVDEKHVQRAIERAKETTQVAGLRDAFVLEFDVRGIEMSEVHLERDGLELDINLYDMYGLDGSLRMTNELSDTEKAYLPVLVISYAGKQRTFTAGVFPTESEAQDALPADPATREEIPFRFKSNTSEELRYGVVPSAGRYLPDTVERRLNNAWAVFGLMLLPPLALFSVSVPLGLVAFGVVMIVTFAIEHFNQWATALDGLDLEDVYERASGEREFDVVTCEFESTSDGVVIYSPEHDAEWTFEKNAIGELSASGKQALDAVSVEGQECIACISRSRIDEVNELESDCGEWKLEQT